MSDRAVFSNPPAVAAPNGYTHMVGVDGPCRILFISGQVGIRPDGSIPEDFESQAMQVFRNIGALLESAGAGFGDLVKINVYLTDMASQMPLFRRIRDEFVDTSRPPASTAVQVGALAVPVPLQARLCRWGPSPFPASWSRSRRSRLFDDTKLRQST